MSIYRWLLIWCEIDQFTLFFFFLFCLLRSSCEPVLFYLLLMKVRWFSSTENVKCYVWSLWREGGGVLCKHFDEGVEHSTPSQSVNWPLTRHRINKTYRLTVYLVTGVESIHHLCVHVEKNKTKHMDEGTCNFNFVHLMSQTVQWQFRWHCRKETNMMNGMNAHTTDISTHARTNKNEML